MKTYFCTATVPRFVVTDCPCGLCIDVDADHRAQRIRDIVAQQWAVACALFLLAFDAGECCEDEKGNFFVECAAEPAEMALAALPCAVDVVDGAL